MKQSFTLESDLAMIINLLADMVDDKNLSQKQMEQIMEKIFNQSKDNIPKKLPSESVVKTIMSYSQALDVLKPGKKKRTYAVIRN